MEGQGEAAADVLTGGIVAQAIEPATGTAHVREHHGGKCRNCGTPLNGAYCVNCGQAAHLHRSLLSLGHDILHGVFHFEGKIWRTIPELFFHPGRLTRRYIDGERVTFVSPMALYLFTVFLMFAVFSFTSGPTILAPESMDFSAMRDWKTNIEAQIERMEGEVEDWQEQLEAPDLPAADRARLEKSIAKQQAGIEAMEAMVKGDLRKMMELDQKQQALDKSQPAPNRVNLGGRWPKFEQRLTAGIQQANDNPALALYKLKSSGYKFSWALIPLSVPFMWLLFFWRRDIHVYDHAVFVTYSISFMMLLVILLTLVASASVSGAIWGTALGIVPPLHLYKQLRGAYGLSRFGALVRLFVLSVMITVVLVLFTLLLAVFGALG